MYTFNRYAKNPQMASFTRSEPSPAQPDLPPVLFASIVGTFAIVPAHHLDRLELADRAGEIAALRTSAAGHGITEVFVLKPEQLEAAVAEYQRLSAA